MRFADVRPPVVAAGKMMSGKRIRSYEGSDITIRYDPKRCIHAAECVRGLGRVFNSNARPWINADGAPADEIAEVIHRCPTGALSYEVRGQIQIGPPTVPVPVELSMCADGPIYVHGSFVVSSPAGESADGDTRLALCRCGASDSKPYCDNSHVDVEFYDAGMVKTRTRESDGRDESLTITLLPNGPVLLRGRFVLTSADGSSVFEGEKAALCRCGESANKPFCDGVHSKIGFQAN